MSSNPNEPNSEWIDCPEGMLKSIVHRKRAQKRAVRGMAIAISAVVLIGVGVFSAQWWQGDNNASPNSNTPYIACHQVVSLLPLYVANELSPTEEIQIKAHLEYCDRCRAIYDKLLEEHTELQHAVSQNRQAGLVDPA